MKITKKLPEPSKLQVTSLVIGEQQVGVVVVLRDTNNMNLHAWTLFLGDLEHQRLIANPQPAKSFADMFIPERVQTGGQMSAFVELLGENTRRTAAVILAEAEVILTEMGILPTDEKEPTQ